MAKLASAAFPLVGSVIKKDVKKKMAEQYANRPQPVAMPDYEAVQRARRREAARTMTSGRASTILTRSANSTLGPT